MEEDDWRPGEAEEEPVVLDVSDEADTDVAVEVPRELQALGRIYGRLIVGGAPKSYEFLPRDIQLVINCQCKELLGFTSHVVSRVP